MRIPVTRGLKVTGPEVVIQLKGGYSDGGLKIDYGAMSPRRESDPS